MLPQPYEDFYLLETIKKKFIDQPFIQWKDLRNVFEGKFALFPQNNFIVNVSFICSVFRL